MGTFIALEGAEDSFKDDLLKSAAAAGQLCAFISLRTLRKLPPEVNTGQYILSKVAELIGKLSNGRTALLVLDNFDVWAPVKPIKDSLEGDDRAECSSFASESVVQREATRGNDQISTSPWRELEGSIATEKGIEEKFAKTKLSWIYRLLYFLRYSMAYRLEDDGCRLFCLGFYANANSTRPFFSDIFHHTYERLDVLQNEQFLELGLELPKRVVSEQEGSKTLTDINRYLDTAYSKEKSCTVQINPLYQEIKVAATYDTLQLQIPFDVECSKITLSMVTLICGEQGSGKSTLLNAIIKAWSQGSQTYIVSSSNFEYREEVIPSHATSGQTEGNNTQVGALVKGSMEGQCTTVGDIHNLKTEEVRRKRSVYKLEFYNILSQYVGCGESFIRRTFQKARNNKPALVAIDDVELLFQEDRPHSEQRQGFDTLARTLTNELHTLDEEEGVIFVASTSGHVTPKQLPTPLTSIPNTTIFLRRHIQPR